MSVLSRALQRAGFALKRAIQLSAYFVVDIAGVLRDAGYALRASVRRRRSL